jgi:hypothetical protein
MLPWLMPGIAVSFAISLVVSGVAGRALNVPRVVAFVLLFSLGIIAAATLTPQSEALDFGARGPTRCDFSRVGLARWDDLLHVSEPSGNILMFIPLGVAIGLLPRSRRKAAIVLGAMALPFAIEAIQLAVPLLDRACESADVVDNLTGLVLGLVAGAAPGLMARRADRRPG